MNFLKQFVNFNRLIVNNFIYYSNKLFKISDYNLDEDFINEINFQKKNNTKKILEVGCSDRPILNNNSKFKNKYKLIGNGEKLKIYNCKTPISEVFAYLPGEHPYEIAPKVDYDTQFEKCMIDPLNRVLKAIGLQTLDTNLIYASALF